MRFSPEIPFSPSIRERLQALIFMSSFQVACASTLGAPQEPVENLERMKASQKRPLTFNKEAYQQDPFNEESWINEREVDVNQVPPQTEKNVPTFEMSVDETRLILTHLLAEKREGRIPPDPRWDICAQSGSHQLKVKPIPIPWNWETSEEALKRLADQGLFPVGLHEADAYLNRPLHWKHRYHKLSPLEKRIVMITPESPTPEIKNERFVHQERQVEVKEIPWNQLNKGNYYLLVSDGSTCND